MANLSQFFVTVLLSSGSVANPRNSLGYQVVTPWGKSPVRSSLQEAWYDVIDRTGDEATGVRGAYMTSQTTNGLSTQGGQTVPLNANEVGVP
jgi:hypothetical protein